MEMLFLIGRILFGGYFFLMGINHFTKHQMLTAYAASKGIPVAGFAVYLAGLLILLGGAGVLLGAYTNIALTLLVLFLIPVTLKMHAFFSIADPNMRMAEMTNFLKNLALLGATLLLYGLETPWPLSLF